MKKVCHVTSVHPATDARIFWKECMSLSKQYQVCLIAPNTEERVEHGIQIYNVNLPQGRFRRQRYLKRVLNKMKEVDADIYHFHDPELMRIGLKIKKRGKKIIFDSHEDVPMQILCKEYLPNCIKRPLSLFYSLYEKYKLKNYDALISVTPTIVERLNKINPNTYMITNYPVLTEFTENVNKRKGKVVCFAGGISCRYMHENIIKALTKTDAIYCLAGKPYPGYLDVLRKLEGWQKVDYKGVISHEEVYDFYGKAVAGVVLLDYTPNVGYHRGTLGVLKLFEYMMAGIPVIATDFDIWRDIIEEYDCGICLDPHNVDAIAEAINLFINNPDLAYQKGLNGRKAVEEKYNWNNQEKILMQIYKDIYFN